MTTRMESLEADIEQAWLDLIARTPAAMRTIWLGRDLRLYGLDRPRGAVMCGTYTSAVLLADLRADVFATLEEMDRPQLRARGETNGC